MLATTRVKWAALALAPYPFLLAQGGPDGPRVLYARDVQPILKAHCVACHADFATPEGLLKLLKKGDPEHSDLVRRMRGLDGKPAMPKGFPPLPEEKIATMARWIAQGAKTDPPKALFARDVQPILKAHCVTCHSGTAPAGGLDLSQPKAMLRAVAKGDPDGSLLLRRIRGLDGLPAMPKGFGPLAPKEVAAIHDWIAEGAYLDGGEATHWAYVAPRLPAVPTVKDRAWVRNPVDAFVMARLEKEGLRPSPEADRATLIRRVSLDLTGLPPTPAETDAFLADKTPGAYERVVDRLLASPHYGETRAQHWLDLARYADSDGFEKDLARTAWRYRDWTIDAFNRNLPYDRFVVDQIAGDEIPGATPEQVVATGFSRNSMQNREGGVDQAEAHFNVVLDRVATTATVFMGSTLACARCHDHKYDPFTQRDFYRMAAFYENDVVIPRGDASVSEEKWEEPELRVPTTEQARRLAELQGELEALPGGETVPATPATWTILRPGVAEADQATLKVQADGQVIALGTNPAQDVYRLVADAPSGSLTGLRLETYRGRSESQNFVLTGLRVWADGKPVDLDGATADFTQDQFDPASAVVGNPEEGWAVHPKGALPHHLIVPFAHPLEAKRLKVWLEFRSKYDRHSAERFRLSATTTAEPSREDGRSLAGVRRARLRAEVAAVERAIPSAMVLRERPGAAVPKEHVRTRGEFLSPAEEVTAGTPACLPSLAAGRPNRLALGRWLVARENPLTARVEANRLWEEMFGTGLVETSEDFGTQGTPPTHPELLDWLAVRLRDGGWNVKALLRTIVTSATYRQSSVATAAGLRRDPYDHLLARYPRVRLDAETIRDNALAAAGLLSLKVGGPSVMPDQPDGVWDTPFSGERWMRADGEARWRRGMYTFWKRSAPYPAFLAFDATSRETCVVRRIRTNTPLQALALLNDTGMLAAAQALGDRMIREGGPDPLGYGFRLATGRRPEAGERARLAALKSRLVSRYRAKPAEAAKLGGPERAAQTLVANVLLNLDETITKE